MAYGDYETYYIKEEELKLLLAGIGMTKWYGLSSGRRRGQEKEKSKEELYALLLSLYQKGYIEWKQEGVQLLWPVSQVAEILKKASGCVQVKAGGEEGILMGLYYATEGFVLLEVSQREPGMLRFSLWEEEELMTHFEEIGLFPEEGAFVEKICFSFRDKETGMEEARLVMEEDEIFTCMTWQEGFETNKKVYQQQECEALLRGWFHKEEQL